MNPERFVDELRSLKIGSVFNPYSDRCTEHDRKDTATRRCSTLLAVLKKAARVDLDAVWLGRDFGHRGGRRTGLAFTDDVNLDIHMSRWNLETKRATKGELISELSATVIWSALSEIDTSIFLWNVFPLHPHLDGSEFTNRRHNSKERCIGEDVLQTLIDMLRPRRLISIGNDANSTALRMFSSQNVAKVRHPSYGGSKIFLRQITDLYECQ